MSHVAAERADVFNSSCKKKKETLQRLPHLCKNARTNKASPYQRKFFFKVAKVENIIPSFKNAKKKINK